MEVFQIDFIGNGQPCSAEVELEGIGDSWDAQVKVKGHPVIHELRVRFWLDSFLLPVFSSRADAQFFEPLLEAIDAKAKLVLPKEFGE
ncbi:MAG: hypothetical protein J7621_14750 [Niastella sp.]|nr:hypothetical protein [Niastella sp.]